MFNTHIHCSYAFLCAHFLKLKDSKYLMIQTFRELLINGLKSSRVSLERSGLQKGICSKVAAQRVQKFSQALIELREQHVSVSIVPRESLARTNFNGRNFGDKFRTLSIFAKEAEEKLKDGELFKIILTIDKLIKIAYSQYGNHIP